MNILTSYFSYLTTSIKRCIYGFKIFKNWEKQNARVVRFGYMWIFLVSYKIAIINFFCKRYKSSSSESSAALRLSNYNNCERTISTLLYKYKIQINIKFAYFYCGRFPSLLIYTFE